MDRTQLNTSELGTFCSAPIMSDMFSQTSIRQPRDAAHSQLRCRTEKLRLRFSSHQFSTSFSPEITNSETPRGTLTSRSIIMWQ